MTRICFIGGGSYNWMPKLLGDLALTPDLHGEIVLHDINRGAMDDIQRYGRKVMVATGADFTIETSGVLEDALAGAEFVVITITVGGLDTMGIDLDLPKKYGIYQSVGDTVGPGGLSRALRNVPVLADIARTMDRVCPDAWLLNLTNPMTVLTRVMSSVSNLKVVGLCHELMGVRAALMRMFGGGVEDYDVRVAGVNHLIWLLDLKIRGQDGFALIRQHLADEKPLPVLPDQGNWHDNFLDRWRVKMQLFDLYGALPAAGDRHLAEFFPYFLTPETDYGAEVGVGLTTIPNRQNQVAQARENVQRAIAGDLPPVTRSAEATAEIISAVANGRSTRTIVNLPNTGQIENLPRGAVVETLAELGPTGPSPLTVGVLPLGVLSTLQPHVVNQELIAQAALTGDRRLALQALVNDPLVGDLKVATALLDELLEAHARFLPQFGRRVAVAA